MDPGSNGLVQEIHRAARDHSSILLANHGPVASGTSLDLAIYAAEELEEDAKVAFVLEGKPTRYLDAETIARLTARRS